jgi:cysteine-rich repeat protein
MPRVALAAVLLLPLLAARPASGLPDLVAEILSVRVERDASVDPDDVAEGCAGGTAGRTLVHFGLRTRNQGADDLVLGDPGCPDCSTNPGAACANPLFVCSPAHGHPHFEQYLRAEVLDGAGQVVASGQKQGFCLLDSECDDPQFSCGFQGISAGCADIYDTGLPCQYIDATDSGLPPGTYSVRVTVDPIDRLAESDETNNVTSAPVPEDAPPPLCPVSEADGLPVPIPDQGVAVATVAGRPGEVERVRVVDLRGLHDYVGDLGIHLRSPSGTDVLLMDHLCEADLDFALDLGDDAPDEIPCPPTDRGFHRPSEPLSTFTGEPADGTWTLEVRDDEAADAGELQSFGLEICLTCGNGTLDPGEACDDGNENDGDCCASDCSAPAGEGAACDDPTRCLVGGSCESGICQGGAETCHPCLACQPPFGCVPPPSTYCDSFPPRSAKLDLVKHPSDPAKDSLSWSWSAGAPVALLDFGNPAEVTDLTLCVFDEDGLVVSTTAPAAGTCGRAPCWKATPKGFSYSDREATPEGLRKLSLRPGAAGKARIRASARGAALGLPALGLEGEVQVRLQRSGGPACWQAEFPEPDRNDAGRYKARLR